MIFCDFDRWVERCTTDYMYAEIYRKCKRKTEKFLLSMGAEEGFRTYYLRECRLGSLRYLVKTKRSSRVIELLKECEAEEKDALLHEVFADELKKENINWKYLFLIMGQVGDDELAELSERYFKDTYQDTRKYASWLGNNAAVVLNQIFSSIEGAYFRIVTAIAEVVEEPKVFLNTLEHRLKVLEKKSGIRGLSTSRESKFEEYFRYLCEKEAYDGANSFLDRIWKKSSGRKLFGKDISEVKGLLFSIPHPSLLTVGLDYISLQQPEYTYEEWYGEVERLFAGTEVWKSLGLWMQVGRGIHRLYENREECNLKDLSELPMYDVEEHKYMTRMCTKLAEIIQDWMLCETVDDKTLTEYLHLLKDKNLFSYELYDRYTFSYHNYSGFSKLDWEKMRERLYRIPDAETMVYVYFHTPLWLGEDLFSVVHNIVSKGKLAESQTIERVFSKYTFDGKIVYEKRLTTGWERFRIVPRNVCWSKKESDIEKKAEGEQVVKARNGVVYVTEDWLSRNVDKMPFFSVKWIEEVPGKRKYLHVPCTFRLYELKGDILYVTDLEKVTYVEEEEPDEAETTVSAETTGKSLVRKVFDENLTRWYRAMTGQQRFIKWGMWEKREGEVSAHIPEPMKVKSEEFTLEERVEYAERFVDLLLSFGSEHISEIARLLHHCSFSPLQNVNEFRYIETQHWTDFELNAEQEKRLYQKAVRLLEDEEISQEMKLEIYMNTCLQKVYPLERLVEKNPEIAKLLFAPQTEWIVPVKYIGSREKWTMFSMKSLQKKKKINEKDFVLVTDRKKQNVIKSDCEFFYDGLIDIQRTIPIEAVPKSLRQWYPNSLRNRFVLYATLKGMRNGRFEIGHMYARSEDLAIRFPWREYKKCFYDMKKSTDIEQLLSVHKRLKNIFVTFDSLEKYNQIAGEMDEVCSNLEFDVEKCRDVLLTMGQKNAFWDMSFLTEQQSEDADKRKEAWKVQYKDSYDTFLKNARKAYIGWIGTVYYLSHLQLVVDEQEFAENLAVLKEKSIDEMKEALSSCKKELAEQVENNRRTMEWLSRQRNETT